MKFSKIILITLIILSAYLSTLAQNNIQQQRDSLCEVLNNKEGKDKLKTYQRLTILYKSPGQKDTLLYWYNELDKEAIKQGDLTYQGLWRTNLLGDFLNLGMFDEVISLAPEYLEFLAKEEVWRYYYQVYQSFFKAYLNKGESETALHMAQKIYEEAKNQQNDEGMAIALYSMSDVYSKQFRFEESTNSIKQCIELLKDNEPLVHILASAYNRLCTSLLIEERFDELLPAIREFEKVNLRYEEFAKAPVLSSWGNLWHVYIKLYLKTGEYDLAEFYCNKMDSAINNFNAKKIVYKAKAQIFTARGQYEEALKMTDVIMDLVKGDAYEVNSIMGIKMDILAKMGNAEELYQLAREAAALHDSIRNTEFNVKIDELHTQYEVDKHIAEKEQHRIQEERNRNYFLFALSGCILLIILLVIWIRYSRIINKKNRGLVSQIKEIRIQEQQQENNLLNKTTFEPKENDNDDGFCPESRRDKLCITIRDLILKDKIYREPSINRDYMLDKLGVSRAIFDDAVQHCFEMSFPEYINHLRMKDALKLLEESDLSIEIIAENVGYGSVRTFQRQFQNKYNMSPKDYRKLAKEKQV